MQKTVLRISAALAGLAFAANLLAGGFWLQLGNPDASAEARALNAVLTIKATGCHEPDKAQVSATAIGLVDGERRSRPLKLAPLREPGMYAVTERWLTEGRWVIEMVGVNGDAVTSAIAVAGPGGVDRAGAKFAIGRPAASEVDAMLRAGSPAAVAKK